MVTVAVLNVLHFVRGLRVYLMTIWPAMVDVICSTAILLMPCCQLRVYGAASPIVEWLRSCRGMLQDRNVSRIRRSKECC